MNDEGRGKGGKQGSKRGRSGREIKGTSVVKNCLFSDGQLQSDTVKQALLSRVQCSK